MELEIDVARVLSDSPEGHLAKVAEKAVAALPRGNVVVRTSRNLVTGSDAGDSLAVSRQVSTAVVEVVRQILAGCPPRFVVTKGGITSPRMSPVAGWTSSEPWFAGPCCPGSCRCGSP